MKIGKISRSAQKSRNGKTATKLLRPVRPNAGIEAAFRKRLLVIIDEMQDSVIYWMQAAYRKNPPRLAQDETAASTLRRAIHDLTERWQARFDEGARELGDYFATAISDRSDAVLKKILKDSGFAIEWTMTAAQKDVFQATVAQSVGLIKSIPQRYLGQVETLVMQSVQRGGDLESLSKAIRKQYRVTRRRAEFIARDQNAKATASFTRARFLEIGIEEAIWAHSGGGAHPRPSHMKAGKDKVRFPVAEGWLDPDVGEKIQPGELPNCRCFARPVLSGF